MRTTWRVQLESLDGRSLAQIPLTRRTWLPGTFADPGRAMARAIKALQDDPHAVAVCLQKAGHDPEPGRRLMRTINARRAQSVEGQQ